MLGHNINEKQNKALRAAIAKNDLKGIEDAYNAGANLDAELGFPPKKPLANAIERGFVDAVKKLIALGANVNGPGFFDQTPLMVATLKDNNEICKILIASGARLELRDGSGDTALLLAAVNACNRSCQTLIDAGADVEAKNDDGKTPLWYAVENNHRDVGKALIIAGAKDKDHLRAEQWVYMIGDEVRKALAANSVPTEQQCFTDGKLSPLVIKACAAEQFGPLIGEPLIQAKQFDLFRKVWEALPERYQHDNQGIYIEYAKKELEIKPASIDFPDTGRSVP